MKPLNLIAGLLFVTFGILEYLKDSGSALGMVLLLIGIVMLATARKKQKRSDNSYFDNDASGGGFFDSGDFG